ncbi:unnamed protein product, partial [Brassica rapa subsp. trilocularis]
TKLKTTSIKSRSLFKILISLLCLFTFFQKYENYGNIIYYYSSVGSICSQEKPYALKSGPFDLLQTELLYWDVLRVAPISISFLNPKTECSNYYHVLLL